MTFTKIKRMIGAMAVSVVALLLTSCQEPLGMGVTTVFEHRDCQSVLLLQPEQDGDGRAFLRIRTDGILQESDKEIESQILDYHHRKASDIGSAMDLSITRTFAHPCKSRHLFQFSDKKPVRIFPDSFYLTKTGRAIS